MKQQSILKDECLWPAGGEVQRLQRLPSQPASAEPAGQRRVHTRACTECYFRQTCTPAAPRANSYIHAGACVKHHTAHGPVYSASRSPSMPISRPAPLAHSYIHTGAGFKRHTARAPVYSASRSPSTLSSRRTVPSMHAASTQLVSRLTARGWVGGRMGGQCMGGWGGCRHRG